MLWPASTLPGGPSRQQMCMSCRPRDSHLLWPTSTLLLITFLFHANSLFPISTHGFHITGSLNDRADALSRPQSFPSYNDVWTEYEDLHPLQCYRVPQKLIAMISITEADAGAIRTGNEATACSHSVQFKNFGASIDHLDISFAHKKQSDAESILASFAIAVPTGDFSASRKPVALKSVKNHVLGKILDSATTNLETRLETGIFQHCN